MAKDFSELYASIYKSFIAATIVAFLIGMSTNGLTSYGCYQTGYSVCALAIMLILIKLLNKYLRKQGDSSMGSTFLTISPFVLMLFCIGYILYFNIKYKNIILDGHVSSGYYTFSNISVILLLIQLFIIYSIIFISLFNFYYIKVVIFFTILFFMFF